MTSPSAPTPASWMQRLRRRAGEFWLGVFFWLCARAPFIIAAARPLFCRLAFAFSPSIRQGTRANAALVLGPSAPFKERERLARQMLSSFYLFCQDVGQCKGATKEQLLTRVEEIEGRDHYHQARANRRGIIVITAHMGSFEVAMAALTDLEKHVHVLFRRDDDNLFERQRSDLRRRLGVHEAVVDDGLGVWITLRQALLDDQAVVIQGDRVLPGQKGRRVPFLGGEIELPLGPFKLALASGAPIVPIFSIRAPTGRIRLVIEPAVNVAETFAADLNSIDACLNTWSRVLEKHIAANAGQWLLLHPAQIE